MRLTSTRDTQVDVGFREAVVRNVPPDGGLFVPRALPQIDDIDAMLALPWAQRCAALLTRLLDKEFDAATLRAIAADAFDFPVPLVALDANTFALELFHGPSLAFKDFGARFLARVLEHDDGGPRTILTATSGDTGAAVAAAFWRRPGMRVVVLYPAGRVSPLQERQLACLGDNVHAVAVDGSFDDCQRLARACFADAALTAQHGLTSANSINIARLLAQILYYFEGVAAVRRARPGCVPVIAVPSGNFGNLCAGFYARALGLPVRQFVAATNSNRTVPDYLESARYAPRASVATLSNAMDVGAPSNWERIVALVRGATTPPRDAAATWAALREALRWGAVDDATTVAALRERGCTLDPHSAVGWRVLRDTLRDGETGIVLGTAHPAKFAEVFAERLGVEIPLPEALARLRALPLRRVEMAPGIAPLRELLRATAEMG